MGLEQRCKALVQELELGRPGDIRDVVPLTGGVASDIAMIDLGDRRLCAKFALPKLKVAADWHAPVHRNAAEYAWLQMAARAAPQNAIQVYGRSKTAHGFVMEFLDGDTVYLWKDRLLQGAPDQGEAPRVATLLGRIHALSARPAFDRTPFHNQDDFHALRIDPYLVATRQAHPDLAPYIAPLEAMLYDADAVLVHGDASPKNILFRDGAPVVLDAECATMGDASFDPAFCINHLILKAIHRPKDCIRLMGQVTSFWAAYVACVDWEDHAALEHRVSALLPVLMLARVDGKSPVEYLSTAAQRLVRDIAIPFIETPVSRIDHLIDGISKHISGSSL